VLPDPHASRAAPDACLPVGHRRFGGVEGSLCTM
jgi:hypothetical protein